MDTIKREKKDRSTKRKRQKGDAEGPSRGLALLSARSKRKLIIPTKKYEKKDGYILKKKKKIE